MKKAIVLLSGGLDSTVTLYYAKKMGYQCSALIFDYGQRHKKEIRAAKKISKITKTPFQLVKMQLPWKGSALLDRSIKIPNRKKLAGIPATYVPARNTIFLSFALSFAEAIGAQAIFIGAHAVDYSGYPDCRPEYFKAWKQLIRKALKVRSIEIKTPLLHFGKAQIIRLGNKLKAPLEITWSCYAGGEKPCGVCDSCKIRSRARQHKT